MNVVFAILLTQQPTVFDSARKGDVVAIRRYLDAGGDPNARETKRTLPSLERNDPGGKVVEGDTLLVLAVEAQTVGLIKLLLQRKADPNRAGEYGYTPLINAASRSNADLVRTLLRAGAKPDLRNDTGDTALVFAANDGNIEIADMLLRRGASLRGGTGWTPLMQAAYNGQTPMAQLLLRRGADPNQWPAGLMSPLECAIAQSHDGIAALLRKRGAKGRVVDAEAERKRRWAEIERSIADREAKIRAVPPTPMTNEDPGVIEAAMGAFIREYKTSRRFEGAKALRLVSETTGPRMFSDHELNGRDESRAFDVSLEMRRDLAQRNRGITSLDKLKPTDAQILVVPRKETERTEGRIDWKRPYAVTSLPGYSPARDRAVVYFYFGPTPHGASGTVFLRKQGDVWQAAWCELRFYV